MSMDVEDDAFLAKYKKELSALEHLFPNETDFPTKIKLITHLKGQPPNLQKMYLANCEWKIFDAMESGEDINWDYLDPVKFLTSYAPSLKGRHADRAVEIARATQITAEKSLIDRMLGKE